MMSNKLIHGMMLTISLLIGFLVVNVTTTQAATAEKVLLVYDSQNNTQKASQKIDALQRSLTGMNLSVKTVGQADYKSGMLNKKYYGVITMINWREVGMTNQAFLRDRQKFQGIKLHIGQNLEQNEIQSLGGQAQKIYRQQFILKNNSDEQLLPFSESITVLDGLSNDAQTFGTLTTQQTDQKQYAFGIINGKNGYLPFFKTNGLAMLVQMQMIGQLFSRVGSYQPLLTITNVTPYSNLNLLDKLSLYCYEHEIPFAVSTTSVSRNTDLKAFGRFTAALRRVESRDGMVFLNAPEVSSADNSGVILNQKFSTYLVSLARHQVFPAGVSAPGYWNQDQVLRENFLDYADHWLLLPTAETSHVGQDNDSAISTRSYFSMKLSSLKEVKQSSEMNFAIPTALTIAMPDSTTDLNMLKQELKHSPLSWYDPVADGLQTKVETPSTVVQYKSGNYFINGKAEQVQVGHSAANQQFTDGKPKAALTGYFKVQGHVFMIFFIIVTIVLLIFIYFGQRVYWNRFRRK